MRSALHTRTPRLAWGRRATAALALVLTLGALGCGEDDSTPPLTPTLAISLTPTTLSTAAGAGGTATVNLTRGGGFAGAVTLSLEGAPAGMSGSFAPASVPGSASNSTLTLATTAATAPGSYTITVRGRGEGVQDATATLAVTVTAAPSVGIAIAVTPTALPVTQGDSGKVVVALTRAGGFAGAVDLSLEGAPAGVTGSFAPASLSGGTTSSTLTLRVGAGAAVGASTLTIRARGQGVADQTAALALTVNAPAPQGSFALSLSAAMLSMQQGGNGGVLLRIARSGGFTGPVTITASGVPSGVILTAPPLPVPGDTVTIAASAAATTAPGTYNVVLTGRAQGMADQTVTLLLTITAAPSGGKSVAWKFCDAASLPIWFAAQNGTGTWTQVNATGNTFNFSVDGKGGAAFVQKVEGSYILNVYYATADELRSFGTDWCDEAPGGKRLSGTVAGLEMMDQATISMGSAMAMTFGMSPAFTLTGVPDGPLDLIAARTAMSISGENVSMALNKLIIRRGVNLPNGATIPTLDFAAAEAFAPASATLTIAGLGADSAFAMEAFMTKNRTSAFFFTGLPSSGATRTYYGVPSAKRVAGDEHLLMVLAGRDLGNETSTKMRGFMTTFADVVDRTVTLGPAPAAATVSVASRTPYPRPRVQMPRQQEYGAALNFSISQQNGRSAELYATAGYVGSGASSWDLTFPDLSGAGFNPTWAPQAGSAGDWSVYAYGTSGSSASRAAHLTAKAQTAGMPRVSLNPAGGWLGQLLTLLYALITGRIML